MQLISLRPPLTYSAPGMKKYFSYENQFQYEPLLARIRCNESDEEQKSYKKANLFVAESQ